MLSPKALLLEESLAVSALTLSVCSQFINTAEEPPSTKQREAGRVRMEPRTAPRLRPPPEQARRPISLMCCLGARKVGSRKSEVGGERAH